MSGWWVHNAFATGGAIFLVAWIFWVLLSITLHELAHGWAAIWEGDMTPRELGRMTANPIVHMGGLSLLVFAAIGIAWGLMPVNPSRFRHRRWGNAIVAAAGPAMNILLALICLTAFGLWSGLAGPEPTSEVELTWQDQGRLFLWVGGWLNLVLCLLNLIPVPPLDGSRILACCHWKIQELYRHPQAQFAGLFLFLVIFWGGVADGAFRWTEKISLQYSALVAAPFQASETTEALGSRTDLR
ncbi:MAG: site-2 protease family protein [Planctomycetota bacterium]|nr:site-2 protease family protein [Planctomycetota bacterium]